MSFALRMFGMVTNKLPADAGGGLIDFTQDLG
jgi:hypothetical protein